MIALIAADSLLLSTGKERSSGVSRRFAETGSAVRSMGKKM